MIIGRVQREKKFMTIIVIIFWHFLIISLRSESLQVKRHLIYHIINLLHKLPQVLGDDLRLRILGNLEMLEKYQMLVETQPSAQSSFQILNVNSGSEKAREIRYHIFQVLLTFTVFLKIVPNIFPIIV